MDAAIRFPDLQSSIRGTWAPLVIDIRRTPAFKFSTEMIAGTLRRDPDQVALQAGNCPGRQRQSCTARRQLAEALNGDWPDVRQHCSAARVFAG